MPNYWLIVERYENWLTDAGEGFARFGLPESKKRLAEKVHAGDLLVTYVSSGRSAFSDIRRVERDKPERLGAHSSYDTAFPLALKTSPINVLPEGDWIRASELTHALSFLYYGDWRQTFRTSLKAIPERDGRIIADAIRDRANRLRTGGQSDNE